MFGVVTDGRARPAGTLDPVAAFDSGSPDGAGGSATEWAVALGSMGLPIPAQRRAPIRQAASVERSGPAPAPPALDRTDGRARGRRPRTLPPVTVSVHRYANAGPDVFWEISTS